MQQSPHMSMHCVLIFIIEFEMGGIWQAKRLNMVIDPLTPHVPQDAPQLTNKVVWC